MVDREHVNSSALLAEKIIKKWILKVTFVRLLYGSTRLYHASFTVSIKKKKLIGIWKPFERCTVGCRCTAGVFTFSHIMCALSSDEVIITVCVSHRCTPFCLFVSLAPIYCCLSVFVGEPHISLAHKDINKNTHTLAVWMTCRQVYMSLWILLFTMGPWGAMTQSLTITMLSFSPYDHHLSLQLFCRTFSHLFVIQRTK